MKIDIWFDILCPFCYIGSVHFDNALAAFPHKEALTVNWRSYLLIPDLQAEPGEPFYQFMAKRKQKSIDDAKHIASSVAQQANSAGVVMNFDNVVVANSFDAHRLIKHAAQYGLAKQMKAQLFKAYFTEGLDIADHSTLISLAGITGLNTTRAKEVLFSNKYHDDINTDVFEAFSLGISSVPTFVIDNRFFTAGALAPSSLLRILTKAWNESEACHQDIDSCMD